MSATYAVVLGGDAVLDALVQRYRSSSRAVAGVTSAQGCHGRVAFHKKNNNAVD